MELQMAAVAYRISELRQIARSLRWERRTRSPNRLSALRVGLGRRLVALGDALIDGTGGHLPAAGR